MVSSSWSPEQFRLTGKTPWETRVSDKAFRNPMQTLRFVLVNVGLLIEKSVELVDMMNRRKVDVAGLPEVSYKIMLNEVKKCTSCSREGALLLKVGLDYLFAPV